MEVRAGERGASVVEMALLTPLLMLLVLVVVQFALYFHARHIVLAAAQAGARVARTERCATPDRWDSDAVAKVSSYIAQLGPRMVENPRPVPVGTNQDTEVGVEVDATAVKVMPFVTLGIHVRSQGPVEGFRADVATPGVC